LGDTFTHQRISPSEFAVSRHVRTLSSRSKVTWVIAVSWFREEPEDGARKSAQENQQGHGDISKLLHESRTAIFTQFKPSSLPKVFPRECGFFFSETSLRCIFVHHAGIEGINRMVNS
jgi:hypothetical protein